MPNWVYNEIYFKTKEDFDKVISLSTQKNHDYTDLKLNKIMPVPQELINTAPVSIEHEIARMAYALKCGNPIEDINEAINLLQKKYPQIKRSNDYKSISMNKDNNYIESISLSKDKEIGNDLLNAFVNNSHNFESYNVNIEVDKERIERELRCNYLEYCKRVLDMFVKHSVTSLHNWCIQNWGTTTDLLIDVVNVDKKCIGFDTAWYPPIPAISKLAKKLSIPIFMRFVEEQGTEDAGEIIFNAKGEIVIERNPQTNLEKAKIYFAIVDPKQTYRAYDIEKNEIVYVDDLTEQEIKKIKPIKTKSKLLDEFLQ